MGLNKNTFIFTVMNMRFFATAATAARDTQWIESKGEVAAAARKRIFITVKISVFLLDPLMSCRSPGV